MATPKQIRTALRSMVSNGEIRAYRITAGGEVHVRDHDLGGQVRSGWTLYGYMRDAVLPLMLGIEQA